MLILVLNCGSTSIKAAVVDPEGGRTVAGAKIERIGDPEATMTFDGDHGSVPCPAADHRAAMALMLPELLDRLPDGVAVEAVGHRVVHGGDEFQAPATVDEDVEAAIERLIPMAPLHNPVNLQGLRAARKVLPDLPHVAVFDTAFHGTLPRRAKTYALPGDLAVAKGYHRYGFHGPSHAFVAQSAADYLDTDLSDLRVITCHLGGGCSITAVEYGRSVETSMGMTPLEGLVMGTRSGDLDPGLVLQLVRDAEGDVDAVDRMLNKESGLAGISGVGRDLRDIEERAAAGDDRCRLAITVFAHRVRKYIGAYAAVMGGVDAICFTAGIGQNSALMRQRIAQRLDFLGARMDDDRNRDASVDSENPVSEISDGRCRTKLLVIATDEQLAIARGVAGHLRDPREIAKDLKIPISISARHIHLTRESVDFLFGKGHELTPRNPLSQPGQFACEETLTVHGPKRSIEGVRVLGPIRGRNQVEISRTDEFTLGIDAPVRASGNTPNSPGVTLEGPKGRLVLEDGLICAWRHIHMTPQDAERFGVKHKDIVDVEVDTDGRDLVFKDVLIRVKDSYKLEMHIDTDEANACDLNRGAVGLLAPTGGTAHLTARKPRAARSV